MILTNVPKGGYVAILHITTMRALTVVDDSYSSPYSSHQLPTLRSRGTESGAWRENGLQLQRPTHPGPMPPTPPDRKPSGVSMGVAGPLSSQDEVVEAIKIDIQGQEVGTVKVGWLTMPLFSRKDELILSRNTVTSGSSNSTSCIIFCCRIDLSTTFDRSSRVNWPNSIFLF
jgi:hypothetical protein